MEHIICHLRPFRLSIITILSKWRTPGKSEVNNCLKKPEIERWKRLTLFGNFAMI